jgi:two-component system sensor kinase FixL
MIAHEPAHSQAIDSEDDFLARRYLMALMIVAVLILIDQAIIQPALYQLTTDAPVISIAGRQRTLSQRLCKVALELDRTEPGNGRIKLLNELAMTLHLWKMGHDGLRYGNEQLGLPGSNSDAVHEALNRLDPLYHKIRYAANRIAEDRPEPDHHRAELATVLAFEGEFLSRMEFIVGIYENEARARVDGLRKTGWVVTGSILLSLLGIGQFILRPATILIRKQFAEVREARDALEIRVAERTIELEEANRELQREVEERSKAEARHDELLRQFSHVSRTTTVGEMATGLAHELNQPLGAMANYVEGCIVALDQTNPRLDEVKEALAKALSATLRAGEIIKRIRRFVNRLPSETGLVAPNRVVAEVEALLRQEAKMHGITLRLELANELPQVVADPVQVQQILVNLVRNATESVALSRPRLPSVVLETRLGPSGDVEFRVSDNGEGITPDRIEKVFDPFFSTREEGMGMGLAISRTLVEAHHGRLTVESTPGVQTVFRFNLPAAIPNNHGTNGLHCG